AVGFGKAAPGAAYPTVYIWGTVGGVRGLFRSTDAGAGWLRINDDDHQYGGPGDAQFVIGDNNTFGNVFMSTAGRGIVFGKPTPLKGEK
ncbi:MAG TPA: exo-alpha-sialidase, partial [Duganella sp.]|nr:exo-alpha-sialidase [Duganella sp.]